MGHPSAPTLAKIHIAKKELGLDDATYRALLLRVTGKDSSGRMTETERAAVLSELKRQGWKSKSTDGKHRPPSSKSYIRLMYAIAKNIDAKGYWELPFKEALRAFVKKETGIDNPE
nr:regulatory protein GemA [uncultured Cohaesibacter sp.]